MVLGVLATAIRQEGKKRHPNWKKRSKHDIYTENTKDFTKKLLSLINEFSNIAGYKICIKKLVAFLYTNNELSERDTEKTIPFTIAFKNT